MKIGTTTKLIPQNIAPENAKRLAIYNGDEKVCDLQLGPLAMPHVGGKLYSVGILSDAHVTTSTTTNDSQTDFPRALEYLQGKSDFICVCGDGVDSGTTENFELYNGFIGENVYSITGNHEFYTDGDPYKHEEATMKSLMRTYARVPLRYTISSNPTSALEADGIISEGGNIYNTTIDSNDVFIMLGISSDWSTFGADGLQWLHATLDANRHKRCFLFEHIRPDDASGNGENLKWSDLWAETNTYAMVFTKLLKHYKNVYFFHGHSHFTLDLQTRENMANLDEVYGRYSIHVPSATYPRGIPVTSADEENGFSTLIGESQGYLMDVYADCVVLKGVDFVTGSAIPIAQYLLDTKIQEIESKAYSYFSS
jgi:hypothetical protein